MPSSTPVDLSALTGVFLLQVVVKTRTEYQTEKKRLKVPKVEEFTISFTDGVSERLKVRICDKYGGRAHRICWTGFCTEPDLIKGIGRDVNPERSTAVVFSTHRTSVPALRERCSPK